MSTHDHNTASTDSPASPTHSSTSSGRTSFHSHGRALSMVSENAPTRSNRFSIQFPIQPSGIQSPTRTSHSPELESLKATSDALDILNGSSDGNYLHLIAAQERRVLELKEELQRAEADLNKFKLEWARQEAYKKREDARRLTRLQTLQTTLPVTDREDDIDGSGSNAWMQQEMERRKALMSATRPSNRTVFPGQRHTRALSLLSPTRDNRINVSETVAPQRPPPPRKDSLRNPARHSVEEHPQQRLIPIPRSSTMTAISDGHEQVIDQESLLRAGKKAATEFRDGLWTFWEDLRQATVGEESTTIHPPRRKSSTQTLRTARKQSSKASLRDSSKSSATSSNASADTKRSTVKPNGPLPDLANPSFWTDHGISMPQPATQAVTQKTKKSRTNEPKRSSANSNDSWDTWDDSPVQSRSSSSVTSETNTLPSTVSGSPPRTSMSVNRESRDVSKKEAIPWPVLKKSAGGLGTLRRTASHLLTEWERSLTPSPGQEFTGEDYMGLGAEAAAYGAAKGKND